MIITQDNIGNFPNTDVLDECLNWLDYPTRVKVRQVSKDFLRIADDNYGWKKLFHKNHKNIEKLIPAAYLTEDWKKRFAYLSQTALFRLSTIMPASEIQFSSNSEQFQKRLEVFKSDSIYYCALFKFPNELTTSMVMKLPKSLLGYKLVPFTLDSENKTAEPYLDYLKKHDVLKIDGFFFEYKDKNILISTFSQAAQLAVSFKPDRVATPRINETELKKNTAPDMTSEAVRYA